MVELNDDLVLLIEDKIHAREHAAQLGYLERIAKHYPDRTVLPVFFKTGDQCDYTLVEEAGYVCFLRQHLLAALDQGVRLGASHPIFTDFLTLLRERELGIEAFTMVPVPEWPPRSPCWIGLFKALKSTRPDFVWQYVPNPSGGFWGAWWHGREWRGQRVYLQIEERQLCFKIHTFDPSTRSKMRDEWRNTVLEAAASTSTLAVARPKRLGSGIWMTSAVVHHEDWLSTDENGLLSLENTNRALAHAETLLVRAAAVKPLV